MKHTEQTAIQAFEAIYDQETCLKARASAFVCPYPSCRVYAEHVWGSLYTISVQVGGTSYQGRHLKGGEIYSAKCSACGEEVIFSDGKMVKPATSEAPAPNADMPVEISGEYHEAAAILPGSPRGAAALLRLAVQKLLPLLGATKRDINDQIGELVGNSTISPRVQTALDTLRVIGNEAVHPGTIDLKDDVNTAMGLFRLLNFIIEKAISDPKHADEMFALIPPGKQAAITQRNDRAIAANSTSALPAPGGSTP